MSESKKFKSQFLYILWLFSSVELGKMIVKEGLEVSVLRTYTEKCDQGDVLGLVSSVETRVPKKQNESTDVLAK